MLSPFVPESEAPVTQLTSAFPPLGFGLGLRTQHYAHIFEHKPQVDWFEIISENFMDTGGRPIRNLERILENYPVVMHGVALSIGTADPLNSDYLQKLKSLMDWVKPAWVSDHLCWTGIAHRSTHDLLPVPYTEEALAHIVDRIKRVQDYLQRPIALENPSTYLEFKSSSMPEAEFIVRMAELSGCNLLLDVNNIYVTCFNHRLDLKTYIDTLPLDRVIQIHLAGHDNKGTHIIDTHDNHVVDEVWALYRYVVRKAGRIPNTMVEWDDNIPDFTVLQQELEKARAIAVDTHDQPLPDLFTPRQIHLDNASATFAEQQTTMQNAILAGASKDAAAWIPDKQQFSPAAQLQVYINAYRYRLYDVVAEDYPALKYYLGEETFEKLLWNFIEGTTSTHFNIARYAAQLPDFIARAHPQDVMAYELCQLETALSQLADAEEVMPLRQESLVGLSIETMLRGKLRPRAALKPFSFTYPVSAYYNDVMEGRDPSRPEESPSRLIVFRHDDTMWRADMEQDEFELFAKLCAGQALGDAIADMPELSSSKVSEWFSRWMHQHFFSTLTLAQSETCHAAA